LLHFFFLPGTAFDGDKLYVCIWVGSSFFEDALEIWTFGAASTYSGKVSRFLRLHAFKIHLVSICIAFVQIA